MMFDEDTKLRAVLVLAGNPSVEHQRLPTRDTADEVHQDIDCFFHRCKCYKEKRFDGHDCLAYSKVEPKNASVVEYIDNDRGARSHSYKVKDGRNKDR